MMRSQIRIEAMLRKLIRDKENYEKAMVEANRLGEEDRHQTFSHQWDIIQGQINAFNWVLDEHVGKDSTTASVCKGDMPNTLKQL